MNKSPNISGQKIISSTVLEKPAKLSNISSIEQFSAWIDSELELLESKYENCVTQKSLAKSLKRG